MGEVTGEPQPLATDTDLSNAISFVRSGAGSEPAWRTVLLSQQQRHQRAVTAAGKTSASWPTLGAASPERSGWRCA